MRKTITIRLTPEQEAWLDRTAATTGRPRGQIVREHLERARRARANRGFMRLAGVVKGAKNLSSRKGFSRA